MDPQIQPTPQNSETPLPDQPQVVQPTQVVEPQPTNEQQSVPMQTPPEQPQPMQAPAVDAQPSAAQADSMTQPFVPPAQPTPVMQPSQGHDAGHGLAIGSLVTSLLGMGLVGIILGIVSGKKSKVSGHKRSVLATLGIVFGIVNIITAAIVLSVMLLGYNEAKDTASSLSNLSRVTAMHTQLEIYRNEKGTYPGIPTTDVLPAADPLAFELSDGTDLRITGAQKNKEDAMSVAKATQFDPYIYAPYECNVLDCKGYVLSLYTPGENVSAGEVYYKVDLDHLDK